MTDAKWPFVRVSPRKVFCIPCARYINDVDLPVHVDHTKQGVFYCVSCCFSPDYKVLRSSEETSRFRQELYRQYHRTRGHDINKDRVVCDFDALRGLINMHLDDEKPRMSHKQRSKRKHDHYFCEHCLRDVPTSTCPSCRFPLPNYVDYVHSILPQTQEYKTMFSNILMYEFDSQPVPRDQNIYDVVKTLNFLNSPDKDCEDNLKSSYDARVCERMHALDHACSTLSVPSDVVELSNGTYALLVFERCESFATDMLTAKKWFPEFEEVERGTASLNPEAKWHTSTGAYRCGADQRPLERFANRIKPSLLSLDHIEVEGVEDTKIPPQRPVPYRAGGVATSQGIVHVYKKCGTKTTDRELANRFVSTASRRRQRTGLLRAVERPRDAPPTTKFELRSKKLEVPVDNIFNYIYVGSKWERVKDSQDKTIAFAHDKAAKKQEVDEALEASIAAKLAEQSKIDFVINLESSDDEDFDSYKGYDGSSDSDSSDPPDLEMFPEPGGEGYSAIKGKSTGRDDELYEWALSNDWGLAVKLEEGI